MVNQPFEGSEKFLSFVYRYLHRGKNNGKIPFSEKTVACPIG